MSRINAFRHACDVMLFTYMMFCTLAMSAIFVAECTPPNPEEEPGL